MTQKILTMEMFLGRHWEYLSKFKWRERHFLVFYNI